MNKFKENIVQSRPFFQPVHLMLIYKECTHGDIRKVCIKLQEINL